MSLEINFETNRKCGGCTLCCKLLPMHEGKPHAPGSIHKPAGQRCPHQRIGKGCAIYAARPQACRFWSCGWLLNMDAVGMSRPDRSRYVIDPMPDFIEARDGDTSTKIRVVQIWCDPKARDAWRDPALLAFLERRGKEGTAALIRFSETEATTVFPPTMMQDGQWLEKPGNYAGPAHSFAEVMNELEDARRVIVEGRP